MNWNAAGGFLQLNAAGAGLGNDVRTYKALEFRVALRCFGSLCSSAAAPGGDVDFSIALANGNGTLSSAVALKSFAVVRRPVGSDFGTNEVLRTVRIPLPAFTGATLASIRGVRFAFDKTTQSSIYLANVRFDKTPAGPGGPSAAPVQASAARPLVPRMADFNSIVAVRPAPAAGVGPGAVDIELRSNRAFPAADALPELRIGGKVFSLSRFADPGQHGLIFTLTGAEYAGITSGSVAEIRVGGAYPWAFGSLRKP